MSNELIRSYENINPNTLEDFWMAVAKGVERSLLQAGAVAGTDYTYLDLYKLAQPFVLETWKREESPIDISISW